MDLYWIDAELRYAVMHSIEIGNATSAYIYSRHLAHLWFAHLEHDGWKVVPFTPAT